MKKVTSLNSIFYRSWTCVDTKWELSTTWSTWHWLTWWLGPRDVVSVRHQLSCEVWSDLATLVRPRHGSASQVPRCPPVIDNSYFDTGEDNTPATPAVTVAINPAILTLVLSSPADGTIREGSRLRYNGRRIFLVVTNLSCRDMPVWSKCLKLQPVRHHWKYSTRTVNNLHSTTALSWVNRYQTRTTFRLADESWY